MIPKVSVIIPIYNVEKHFRKCVISLFEQSLNNIEFIFVDDCTPDGSINILESCLQAYHHLKPQVTILKHDRNRGLAAGRNTGLRIAKGEYIFHCDSDDWLDKNALEKMYTLASTHDLDLVWSDFFLAFTNKNRYMSQSCVPDKMTYLKVLLSGGLKYNVWNKLVKRSIFEDNNIYFPEGNNMGEDMTMIKVAASTERIGYLSEGLYYYLQNNSSAYTKNYSNDSLDQLKHNVGEVTNFLKNYYGELLNKEINFFKLNVKVPFLISSKIEVYKIWIEWYPESNEYIDLNEYFSYRIKILQKIALHQQFWLLRIYHFFFTKLIYGYIYK